MEILRGIDFKIKNSAVSLGKFDGIHQGHRLLLQEILERKSGVPTVFTFDMGPKAFPERDSFRLQIYGQQEKDKILESMGIEREILFPFHEGTRQMLPQDFIQRLLHTAMDARFICVGEDFRFGRDRSGDVELLQKYSEKYGYELKIFPKLHMGGEAVSSTRIRSLIQQGKLPQANQLLGGAFFFVGTVIHGNALGRTLQMPTANIRPDSGKVLPPAGVYATMVTVGDQEYRAVTNLGYKPTFGSSEVTVESCLFDFDRDIYGQEIIVRFYQFLRAERKFSGKDALCQQMQQDKQEALNALSVLT